MYLATDCLPLPGFYEFLDLTLHQVALQSADVADVELSVEVISFVKKGAGKKLLAGFFKPFAVDVLRTNRYFLTARHLFAKLWNREATFTSSLTALDMLDLAKFLMMERSTAPHRFRGGIRGQARLASSSAHRA